MRWNVFPVVVIAIGLTAPVTAFAGSIEEFDVVGMKLRMSVAEIEQAAARYGLTEDNRSVAPSFEQRVEIARGAFVRAADYAAVRSLLYVSDTAQVTVNFVSAPEGERSYRISHMMLDANIKDEDVGKRVEAEYGTPDKKYDNEWLWGDTTRYAAQRSTAFLELRIRPRKRAKNMERPAGMVTLADPVLPKQIKTAVKAEM